ncbi:MAG: photosynthetic complex assembly protein PuhC [Pseudomonadota bacterium]
MIEAKMNSHAIPRHQEDREKVPRVLLRAIGVLLLVVLALVSWARLSGMPPAAMPPDVPIVQDRTIHLFGDLSGAARVLDANGGVIADLGPGKGGFIAGVTRSLHIKRRQAGVDPAAPVRLVLFADGHMGLRDDFTGWRVELIGFGKDNTAAFANLLKP